MTTDYHLLTMEWANYPYGPGEVTACFCSCGWRPEGLSLTSDTGKDGIVDLAKEFKAHVARRK